MREKLLSSSSSGNWRPTRTPPSPEKKPRFSSWLRSSGEGPGRHPFAGSAGEFGFETPARFASWTREKVAAAVSAASPALGLQGGAAFGGSPCQTGKGCSSKSADSDTCSVTGSRGLTCGSGGLYRHGNDSKTRD